MSAQPGNRPKIFVTKIDLGLAAKLKVDLPAQGFVLASPQYTVFQAKKKGVSCTLYESGKLVVQGKEMAEFIEFYLEPEVLQSFAFSYSQLDLDLTPRIGADESGKGDLFGPLCVAALYASGDQINELSKLGIQDSKKMNDKKMIGIAKELKKNFTHHIVRIGSLKYNELYSKFGNLNRMLAWQHTVGLENIIQKTTCRYVILDQFASEHVMENMLKQKKVELDLTQRTKAEEDIVVAAASVLARVAFLDGLWQLEQDWNFSFPKGSGAQAKAAGKKFVAEHGPENLKKVAKMHFKTASEILGIKPDA